jgi:Ca2+-transporting ATPase
MVTPSYGPGPEEPEGGWHAPGTQAVLAHLETGKGGLSSESAAERLRRYGPNRLETRPPRSAWAILIAQFRSVVVLLLAAAALVAFLFGDTVEAVAIVAVLLVNAGIGFPIELRARRAMEVLLRHEVPEATVIRNGVASRVPAANLVPGDVIEVVEGEAVAADARLVEGAGVRTTEAALTGESLPVDKAPEARCDADTPLPERANMIYAGTSVAVGTARGVVVATAMNTELGRIGRLLAGVPDDETPLERRLDALGTRLVWVTILVATLLTAIGVIRGYETLLMLETGIALAIAAVPEGLPVVATIALAIGLRRMARRKASVRRLASVEALGGTTVVCTDKTGTLTAGEMTVVSVVTAEAEIRVTGSGYDPEGDFERDGTRVDPAELPGLDALLRAAAFTTRAVVEAGRVVRGDPTDAALVVLARKAGIDPDELVARHPRAVDVPFTSETRMSASLHAVDGATTAWIKGAPGALLDRSTSVWGDDGPEPLDETRRAALEERNVELAAQGLRVIALAMIPEVDPRGVAGADDLTRMATFLGFVGILDPPAEGVRETIAALRTAGIRVVMITGDQGSTAAAVARDLGLDVGEPIDGRALGKLDDAALHAALRSTAIFSRTSPADKLRIVEALRESGEIVAVLGDGVNDAAALKRADVGVAMGIRGTDVAKEVADLVLRDDRFRTIGAAVEEGRVIFDNIRKFVFYLFSCNVAEVLVVAGGSLAGAPLPLLPLQILWLNLVTDTFPALALAVEPGEPDVMQRPPRRPDATILSKSFVGALLFYSGLITAVTLGAFAWALRTGPVDRAVTMAFATLALAQLFHLGTARARDSVLKPSRAFANRWALGAVGLVVLLQAAALYWSPLATLLGTVPLSIVDAGVALGLAVVPAAAGQLARWPRAGARRSLPQGTMEEPR